MKTLTVNIAGLKMLGEQGLLKDFAVFISFKRIYSSGTVYAKSYRKLAAKLNTSVHSVKKYIPKFITLGWCRWHSDNLVFNSIRFITEVRGGRRKRVVWAATPKKIFQQFSELILKSLEDGFEWAKKLGCETSKASTLCERKLRKLNRILDRYELRERELPKEDDWLKLSVNQFSKILGVSVGKAHSALKRMRIDCVVKCKAKREMIAKPSRSADNTGKNYMAYGSTYTINGYVYLVHCNQYKFAN